MIDRYEPKVSFHWVSEPGKIASNLGSILWIMPISDIDAPKTLEMKKNSLVNDNFALP